MMIRAGLDGVLVSSVWTMINAYGTVCARFVPGRYLYRKIERRREKIPRPSQSRAENMDPVCTSYGPKC